MQIALATIRILTSSVNLKHRRAVIVKKTVENWTEQKETALCGCIFFFGGGGLRISAWKLQASLRNVYGSASNLQTCTCVLRRFELFKTGAADEYYSLH